MKKSIGLNSLLRFLFRTLILSLGLLIFSSPEGISWTGRGHLLICEAAPAFVKNEKLKSYLTERVNILIHLCNIPDTHWRFLKETARGNSTHFFEPDAFNLKLSDMPLDYPSTLKLLKEKGSKNPFIEIGSIWWRANQFVRLAIEAGKKSTSVDSENFISMFTHMGLLGHYVGDVSQPLHSTIDYDGWNSGHGGLHIFYEHALVGQLDADVSKDILAYAHAHQKELEKLLPAESTPVELMKAMAVRSSADFDLIFKLDPVIKASTVREEKGMKFKEAASRKTITKEVLSAYKPLIISEMARSAYLLGLLWTQIYQKAGEPALSLPESKEKNAAPAKSMKAIEFNFPFTPNFVDPDYDQTPQS